MTKTTIRGGTTASRGTRVLCGLLALALMLSALFCLIAIVFPLTADAASSEGMSFTASDLHRQVNSINALTEFTFETEIYIEPSFSDSQRGGVILSDWHSSSGHRDGNEWAIELHQYGTVRFFHQSRGSVFFGINAATGENVTRASSPNASNVGSAADVRTYTADGKYVKLAVVFDSTTGNFQLYVNGNFICDAAGSTVSGQAETICGQFKGQSISPSTVNPYHCIGGDYRTDNNTDNAEYFKGKIRNMALYGDIRTESEIMARATANGFSVDSSDANLRFAYDMTTAKGGRITDLSKNGNHAALTNLHVTYVDTPKRSEVTKTGTGADIAADVPLLYLYVDDNNDGVAEYKHAWLQFNGNAPTTQNPTLGGAFYGCSRFGGRSKCYIVLQGDFTEYTGHYNNMPYLNVEIYIDLNGYSLTAGANPNNANTKPLNSIFSAECKGSASNWCDPPVTVFNSQPTRDNPNNGVIINDSAYPLIDSVVYGINYVTDYYGNESNRLNYQTYRYTFNGITFEYGSNCTAKNPLVKFSNTNDSVDNETVPNGMLCGINITLNDCVFDMTANVPSGTVLFDAEDDTISETYKTSDNYDKTTNTIVNITVNGGNILTSSTSAPSSFTLAQNHYYKQLISGTTIKSEVKFGKNAKGDYIKVTLPAGTAVPSTWTADTSTDANGVLGVYGSYGEDKNALTFANLLDTNTPTEYTLMQSVQYEGKGDYVLAKDYYSKNFAVFLTTMDANGNDGAWTYLGGANYLFNGDSQISTVEGLAHSHVAKKNNHNNHAVAVLTKDCTLTFEGKYSNFAQIRGKLTYDLGGHTLIWNSGTRLVNAEAKIGNQDTGGETETDDQANGLYHSTRFEMKNGTFITSRSSLIVISAFGMANSEDTQYQDYSGVKLFDLDFSDVTFAMSDDKRAIDAFLIKHGADSQTGANSTMNNKQVNLDITFTDCVFDLTNTTNVGTTANEGVSRTLFDATDPTRDTGLGNINSVVDITVNGGKVISDAIITDFKLASCFNATDNTSDSIKTDGTAKGASVTFNRGTDGNYLSVLLPAGSTKPIIAVNALTGEYLGDLNVASNNTASPSTVGSLHVYRTYINNLLTYTDNGETSGEMRVFTLEAPRTENGDVGQNYGVTVPAYYYDDIESYPFLVFDHYTANYRCAGVYSLWGYAMQKLGTQDGSVIFLRRDFNNVGTGNANSGALSNLVDGTDSDSVGSCIIDLNGKTFTRSSAAYFIDLFFDNATSCSKKFITVQNGTVQNDYPWGPICINYSSNLPANVGENVYAYTDFKFDNVTFNATHDYDRNNVGSTPIFWMWEDPFDLLADTNKETNPSFYEKANGAFDKGFVKINVKLNDCNVSSVSYTPLALRAPDEYYKDQDGWLSYRNRIIYDLTMNGGTVTYKNANIIERNLESEEPLFNGVTHNYTYAKDGYNISSSYTNYSTTIDNTDNITFGKGSDGKYPTVIIPTSEARPAQAFVASSGLFRGDLGDGVDLREISLSGDTLLSFVPTSTSGSNTVYEISAASAHTIRTTDGNKTVSVPAYYSHESYISNTPFWVFDGDMLVLATSVYGIDDDMSSALQYAVNSVANNGNANTLTVYIAANATIGGSKFTNLTYLQKPLTIDLGGNTVNLTESNCLVYHFHKTNGDNMPVTATNGSVTVTQTSAVVVFSTTQHEGNGFITNSPLVKSFVTLKDLKITALEGHSEMGTVVYSHDISATEPRTAPELKLVNCTVDVTQDANPTVTLFDTIDKNGRINISVTVDGGKFISNSAYKDVFNIINNLGNITFTDTETGTYTTLTLPKSSQKPLDVFNCNVDKAVFVKNAESESDIIYIINHFASLDVKLKTNLVFASELLMYSYVPSVEHLISFTIDGIEYIVQNGTSGISTRVIDGALHYAVPVNLPAREAARAIPVTMTMLINDSHYTVRFTVDTVGYAKALLDKDADSEQATLIKDTLAYIKSAYIYFGENDAQTVGEKIDAVIGNHAPILTKSEGTTAVPEGLTGATLVLDARPAIRFYIASGYESNLFSFKQDGTALGYLKGEDANGRYIEIGLVAYRMIGEIDVYMDGNKVGTYHINDYLDYASGDYAGGDKANLVDLTQKFYIYCQSALNYKNASAN